MAITAVRGEKREYRLIVRADSNGAELERRELWLRIDKRPPAPPRIQPDPGTYWDPVSVEFLPEKGSTVSYTVQGDLVRAPILWDGAPVVVGRLRERADFVVQAYSMDEAGNKSPIVTSRYTVDARDPSLEVLSPVTGSFANPQALALSFRNIQWARFTLDGSDPVTSGIPYTGPVTIQKKGPTTVRVAAQPRGTRRPVLRKDVTYTYTPEPGSGLLLDMENGTYTNGITQRVLSVPAGNLYYSLWEKKPSDSDYLAISGISLPASAAGQRPVVLRLRNLSPEGFWGSEYRYFFFIGQPRTAVPLIALYDPEPLRSASRVQVTAAEDALLVVTTDGSRPAAGSLPGTGILDIQPKPGIPSVTVKAACFDGSGVLRPALERRITLETDPGMKPILRSAPGPVPGSAAVTAAGSESRGLVFEITSDGTDPPPPGSGSPRLSLPLSLSVPFGMERSFKVRCAAIDAAGRALAPGDTLTIGLNRKPPTRPVLSPPPEAGPFDAPLAVTIGSTGTVFFSLTGDGTTPHDPAPESSTPTTMLSLQGDEGSMQSYRIKLVAVDNAGNMTEVYGPLVYTLDLRAPLIPPLSGMEDGGRYNLRRLSPVLGDSPWKVCYTVTTDGSAPADPDARSPLLTGASVFSGEDGSVTRFRVKLCALSRNGKRAGERREISFVIDLKPPEVPQLSGMTTGGRYAQPVTVTADPVPADVRLYYSTATGELDPEDPVMAGRPYTGPVTFDVPEGVRRVISIRVATKSSAGNRSLYDRRYRFTVDRELPDDPDVSGLPAGGISGTPVTLALASRDGAIFYEMTDDGGTPRLPTEKSTPYSSPLLLPGRTGASTSYRLLARAYNSLGNASRAARIVTVIVDRTVPAPPAEPRIDFAPENPSVAYLSWDAPSAGRVLYRLRTSAAAPAEYLPYDGPVSVLLSRQDGATISGEAVAESPAGIHSAAVPFTKSLGRRAIPPVFQGARDGGEYTKSVLLRVESPSGQVRYEISTDGEFPPSVTAASPVAAGPLGLDAADGETLDVRIAARAFDPSGAELASDEVRIGFMVDKTPPDPPVATGIEDGGYYQEGRRVTLLAPEGTIYYSLSTTTDAPIPAQTDANRYAGAISLAATSGQAVSYHLVAYTVDKAGNRSREIRAWNVTLDQKIVYAAPTGNDYSDGARGTPVRSLNRALELAAAGSRKMVFAAAGQYTAVSALVVDGDVTIVGGLDPDTWKPMGLDRWTVLSASAPWRSGVSLVSVLRGKVTMRGVELRDTTGSLQSLCAVQDGDVNLESITFTLRNVDAATGLLIHGGAITLSHCVLQASGVKKGSLIAATGGAIEASATDLNGPEGAENFSCIDAADARRITLKGVTIAPGAGQRTRGIRALRSIVAISGSRVQSGAGSQEAIGIDAQSSEISVENSELSASAAARTPTAVVAADSSLRVSRSRVAVAGGASAVGINSRGGDLLILRCTIRGAATVEYNSLLRTEDSAALLANNLFLGGNAGESVCLLVRGGKVDLLNNTIVAGSGGTLTSCILVQGDALPRIVNNILARTGPVRSSAIVVLGSRAQLFSRKAGTTAAAGADSAPVIIANAFAGWERLLRVDFTQGAREPLDVRGGDALNAVDGDPFAGRVQDNITENPLAAFREATAEDYRLARGSECINAGVDLSAARGPGGSGPVAMGKGVEITADLDGRPRPGLDVLESPGPPRGWDIGAYQFSE